MNVCHVNNNRRETMPRKKEETIEDILDRIQDDIETIREKIDQEVEDDDYSFDDEDEE